MKTYLIPLSCLFIISPNKLLSETLDDLVMRNGLIYKKSFDIPYTGTLLEHLKEFTKMGSQMAFILSTMIMENYRKKSLINTVL